MKADTADDLKNCLVHPAVSRFILIHPTKIVPTVRGKQATVAAH